MDEPTGVDWDEFRRLVTDARRAAGISRKQFASMAGWHSPQTVAAFEAGEIVPTAPVVMRIVELLRTHLRPEGDDIVALQHLADRVAKARRQAEKLLARYAVLARRVDELNRGDPGAGSPTRLDGLCRFSQISDLRNDLMRIADMICEQLDQEPARYDRREMAFIEQLQQAGVPLDAIFDALEAAVSATDD